MSDVRYFSHDRDAFSDPKIEDLRADYGMEGYGLYWAILESMCSEPDLALPYTDKRIRLLKSKLMPDRRFNMKRFIDDCFEYKLFKTDGEKFWSDSLRIRMSDIVDISNKRRKAALVRWDRVREEQKKSEQLEEEDREDTKPEEDYSFSLKGIDPEWMRVAQEYEKQIGLLPIGARLDELISYYNDIGADAMIVALKKTNKDNAGNPYPYLRAILESYVKKGIKTKEAAEADQKDFERKQKQYASESENSVTTDEEVNWF